MRTELTRRSELAGGLLLGFAAVGVVFMAGMRKKSPFVLTAVRRTNRAMRSLALRSAGAPGAYASAIRHVGRTTGRPYETPVVAVPTDDGFVIALPYGLNTDWLKNVLASGSAAIVHEGTTYRVDRPEIMPSSQAAPLFPPAKQRTHRRFNVEQFLRLRRTEAAALRHP